MELVDRYLHAVRFWLPMGTPREDILRELSDDIQSQIDERREASGAAVGEPEVATLLKARGHPMTVAARFLPDEALIGPALYPIFRLVVRIVLGYVLAPLFAIVVLGTVAFSRHPLGSALSAVFVALQAFVIAFGVIVIVFASLERQANASQILGNWDPRQLPKVRDPGSVARWESIGVAVGSVALAAFFVALAIGIPAGLPGIDLMRLPGVVWNEFFAKTWRLVVALSLVNFAAAAMMAIRPTFARVGIGVRALTDGLLAITVLGAISPYLAEIPTYAATLTAFAQRLQAFSKTHAPASAADFVHVLGPAADVMVVLVLLFCGVASLITALVEGWRYRKLQGQSGRVRLGV